VYNSNYENENDRDHEGGDDRDQESGDYNDRDLGNDRDHESGIEIDHENENGRKKSGMSYPQESCNDTVTVIIGMNPGP
jgi:hypothetical protein